MSLWVQDVEDRLTELEALDKVLQEGLGKFINSPAQLEYMLTDSMKAQHLPSL